MIEDLFTVMWKEWHEIFLNRRSWRGGLMGMVVILVILGVFMPLQVGKIWMTDPRQLLIWSWLPIFIALSIVTDAFAGERERKTLETLLATRLSDQAILFGKIVTVVLYAWLLTAAGVLIGAVTINIAFPSETILFYRLDTLLIGLGISLLAAALIASIGTLVSLKAPTARQAYQRMSLVLIALWFLPILMLQILPEEVTDRLLQVFSEIDINQAILVITLVLVIADAALLFIAKASFKRSRLILE